MQLSTKTLIGSFSYYRDGSTRNPVSYLYAHDLNNDGVDEVLFVAFETQPNAPEQYSDTSIHIFGWQAGTFKEVTQQWLPDSANEVEGVGDVAFGDFNGDGLQDVFLSAYTDMEHPVNAYALYNTGVNFSKVSMGLQTWQHSVRSEDINKDGFDDVIPTGYADMPRYMGSASGLVKLQGFTGGSGLALGDFMDNGETSVIFVDAGQGLNDTYLFTFDFSNQGIVAVNFVAQLPGPRLESVPPTASSHDIRALPMDFNDDGLLDVLVIGYGYGLDNNATHRSEVQFLLNRGQGVFEDVTTSHRIGFDVSGYVGYTPQVIDINQDGRFDLFLSMPDWLPKYNSTSLLLQQQDHTFVDTGREVLTNAIESGGGQGVVAQGPDNKLYLISEGAWSHNRSATTVYLQSIDFPDRDTAERLSGTRGNDNIMGFGGDDVLVGLSGDDVLNGGAGIDTAEWNKTISEYIITREDAGWRILDVGGAEGSDKLNKIERCRFSDTQLAIDLDGNAGTAAKILGALWGKESVENPAFVGIVLHYLDSGVSYEALLDLALGAILGANKTNEKIVELVFTNLVGEAPTQDVKTELASYMDSGAYSQAGFARAIADLELNATNIDLVGLTSTGLQYTEYVA